MQFAIVHEMPGTPGRIRLRALRPFSRRQGELLEQRLEALGGVGGVRITPRTGSVLFWYADAATRQSVCLLLCGADAPARNEGSAAVVLAAQPEQNVGLSLLNYFVLRPLLPLVIRVGLTVFRAIPYVARGIATVFRGRLGIEALDGAAILVSLLRRDFRTARTTMFLLGLGEVLEAWTRQRSLASLTESLSLKVGQVWVLRDGAEIAITMDAVRVGDVVVVRDGGAIPVDGVVVDGEAMVNQASMTGEPLAVRRAPGAAVFAGTVVEEGVLHVRASRVGDETRLQQIARFIDESEALKAGIQGRYERLADMAVPFTFLLAAAVWMVTRNPLRASSVLLVDYSCALRLATPLAVLAAMREAVQNNVLIKGGRYIEALAEADTVVFDKTGTLTRALPRIERVVPVEGNRRDEILRLAACLEEHFPHPVARAVVRQAELEGLKHEEEHTEVQYVVAHGIASLWRGRQVLIGSRHFVEGDSGVDLSPLQTEIDALVAEGFSLLYLAEGGRLAGVLGIADPLREESASVIRALHEEGIDHIVMLTGDDRRTAAAVAGALGIDEFRAQVLPADKAAIVRQLGAAGRKVMMIGDGLNDSPALSAASVGISLRDGADLAQEVANVVLLDSGLASLLLARRLARSALARIHSNFWITMLMNSLFLGGGLLGLLTPGRSALLHNATTLGIAVRAMRPLLPAAGSAGQLRDA
ncbi:MAG TPA: heavy metal translocating P-type ATPase [Candidatus Avidesulfovibrio excrementigallinarum]|nr:heavy metal translocating P-type ATPase [Candidatus Avidesulfovibrio excrementigallinarum]